MRLSLKQLHDSLRLTDLHKNPRRIEKYPIKKFLKIFKKYTNCEFWGLIKFAIKI